MRTAQGPQGQAGHLLDGEGGRVVLAVADQYEKASSSRAIQRNRGSRWAFLAGGSNSTSGRWRVWLRAQGRRHRSSPNHGGGGPPSSSLDGHAARGLLGGE